MTFISCVFIVTDFYFGQLKEMFPHETTQRITDALKHGKNDIDDAISFLLGDFDKGNGAEFNPVPKFGNI
jgi:hypothetical protein